MSFHLIHERVRSPLGITPPIRAKPENLHPLPELQLSKDLALLLEFDFRIDSVS